jgi:hypothetical protein
MKREQRASIDELHIRALEALDDARALPHGPERTAAMKKAGALRNAADRYGIFFDKIGLPPKA